MKKLLSKIKSWFSKEKTTIDLRVEALIEKYVSELKGDAKAELRALIEDVKDEVRKEKSIVKADLDRMTIELGVEQNKIVSVLKKYIKGFKVTL